jgi:hypothetical protein
MKLGPHLALRLAARDSFNSQTGVDRFVTEMTEKINESVM